MDHWFSPDSACSVETSQTQLMPGITLSSCTLIAMYSQNLSPFSRAPKLPLECFHGNGYTDGVEVARNDDGVIEGLYLKVLMDGERNPWCTLCVHLSVCMCVCAWHQ